MSASARFAIVLFSVYTVGVLIGMLARDIAATAAAAHGLMGAM